MTDDVGPTFPAKGACGALLAVLEFDTPMNELRYALSAGGFAGTPERTARFVSLVVSRGWARLATTTWPAQADPSGEVDVTTSRQRILIEAAHDPRPTDALVLLATDTLVALLWAHVRRRPAHWLE